eukprot:1144160-Pelagomonas_calceolata.AAC.2
MLEHMGPSFKVGSPFHLQIFIKNNRKPLPIIITPDCILRNPQTSPPPARSRWPPVPSGNILESTCRLGGAAGGSRLIGGKFCWLNVKHTSLVRSWVHQMWPASTENLLSLLAFRRFPQRGRGGLAGKRQDITQGCGA